MARAAKKKDKGAATKGGRVKPPGTGSKTGTGRAVTKARRTVTLDVDVVTELESRGGSVSAQLNEFALRGLAWEKREAQIMEMVAEYEAEFGQIDEADVKRWEGLLS